MNKIPLLYPLLLVLSVVVCATAVAGWIPLPLSVVEVLGFVSGVWAVWLAAKNHTWSWPIGIANSVFFVVLFVQARLFFDSGINVFYVVTSVWGWLIWANMNWLWTLLPPLPIVRRLSERIERYRHPEPITELSTASLGRWIVVAFMLTLVMWKIGLHIRDMSPLLDAATTSLSLVAQILLMRRVFENWYFWIAADLLYIPMYLSRGLGLTAVLYTIFLVFCIKGIFTWSREIHNLFVPIRILNTQTT